MTITDFGHALRRRWLIILVALLLGAVGGGVAAALIPQQYTAQATLYISSPRTADGSSAAYDREQVALQRTKSYALLVTDPRVLAEVVARFHLGENQRHLTNRVSASSPLDSTLINVSVVDQSPAQAAQLANGVADVFAGQAATIEPRTIPGAPPDVQVTLIQPASVPDSPSSPSPTVVVALGLLTGLVVGVAGALIRDACDRSIRSTKQLRRAVAAPVVGTVARDGEVGKRPLPDPTDPASPRTEAFRWMRAQLRVLDLDRSGGVILVAGAAPGEGRTSTVLDLAATAGAAGSRVLVVDADLRRPAVATLLGMARAPGLTEVVSGAVPVAHAIRPVSRSLDVLTSGEPPSSPAVVLDSPALRALLADLRKRYDLVFVDSSPLLSVADAAALAPVAVGALVVCRYGWTTRAQVTEAADRLTSVSTPILGTVLTVVPERSNVSRQQNAYLDGGSDRRVEGTRRTTAPVSETVAADAARPPRSSRETVVNNAHWRPTPSPRGAR